MLHFDAKKSCVYMNHFIIKPSGIAGGFDVHFDILIKYSWDKSLTCGFAEILYFLNMFDYNNEKWTQE